MRHLKTFVIAMAIMVSGNAFANSGTADPKKRTAAKNELSKLLEDKTLVLKQDLQGKVIFSLNGEREIVVHAVLCNDEFLRNYVMEKMDDKDLEGAEWQVGKVYILPVAMKKLS